MQRRRIVAMAAMVTAAAAAVALTLPAVAGTGQSRQGPARATGTAGDVAPQLLRAMQRDLGLTDGQVRTRLKTERWASRVTSELKTRTGGSYAGAWLSEGGDALTVAVTDDAMVDEVRATGARVKLVERSEQDLDTIKQRLDDSATRADRELPGWYVDPSTNSVVLLARPGQADRARELAENAGVPADAVRVKATTERPRPLFDVRGADPYFFEVGGGTARCSIGFSVVGGFVTAGHCGAAGTETLGFNELPQGVVQQSTFPGDGDFGFVEVNGDWDPRPVVNDFRGNELPVAGNAEAPVGASICRSGSTTGTFCGVIEAKNQTVNYPEGEVTGLTRTNVCAEGGDSGGPWLSGDQAQGVTSGGAGNCTSGGVTFFQPLNEILAENNLTLVTTEGQVSPPAGGGDGDGGGGDGGGGGEDGQATACADLPAVRSGELSRSGVAEAQPDGRFFRARAGRQVACLDGPDGADFDLFLQRLTGGGFQTVAQATGPGGDKQLAFRGRAGTYRYVVFASDGAGDYTLGFDAS